MIEVTLTEDGGFGGWIDFFHSIDGAEEVLIEGCGRCLGLIILWKRKGDCPKELLATQYASSSFHIPPYLHNAKSSRSQFFKLIRFLNKGYEPRIMFYCGGRIDTAINRAHYDRSKKFFMLPLQRLFPRMESEGLDPTPEQSSSNMYMNEFLEVVFEQFVYTTNP